MDRLSWSLSQRLAASQCISFSVLSDSTQLRVVIGREAEILICNVNVKISAKAMRFFGSIPTAREGVLV